MEDADCRNRRVGLEWTAEERTESTVVSGLQQGFRVGSWTVEPLTGQITGPDDESRHLQPKVMQVLVCLAAHANEPVTRDELLTAVWGERAVSDEPLTHAISELRRALQDDRGDPAYIETIPKRGYRLIGHVEVPKRGASGTRAWGAHVIAVSLLVGAAALFAYNTWWDSGPAENSIAVLAFENLSGDPDQEYFSDGVSEEILNLLAQMPELTVISRSSSFSFKDKDLDIPSIAEQLNVTHVLEGSVRRDGDQLRITAQLIEARTDSHLWAESFDRDLEGVFVVQDEIAAAIGEAIKAKFKLTSGESARPTAFRAANTAAYDAYLRGRQLIHRRGRHNTEQAVRYLEQSLRLDDNFAPAHAQLAIATYLSGAPTREEAAQRASTYLDRAEALEPNMAETHAGRALLSMRSDPQAALDHIENALALNPNHADAIHWKFHALFFLSRYEEGFATLERLLVIDPMYVVGRVNYVFYLGALGRIEAARRVADELLELSPGHGHAAHAAVSFSFEGEIAEGMSSALRAQAIGKFAGATRILVLGFSWLGEYAEARRIDDTLAYVADVFEGRFDDAIEATQRRLQLNPESQNAIAAAAHVLYAAGRIDEALPLLERTRDFSPEGQPIPALLEMNVGEWTATMRLAIARRKVGDEAGARAAVETVKRSIAAFSRIDTRKYVVIALEAQIAAFEHDPEHAIDAIESRMRLWLRDPQAFTDPNFEELWDRPRFIALQQELHKILAAEREKVLQLICFNNPTPDYWQPLPETCEGVIEQGG